MATQKTSTKKNNTEQPNMSNVDIEKEEMKKQIAELQAMIKNLANQTKDDVKTEKADVKYNKKRSIKFINLCMGTLVLKGTRFWNIEGQFNSRMIPESEARVILTNTPQMVSSGMVCVPDRDFLAEYDLDDVVYGNVLNDSDLKQLLNKNAQDVLYLYENASDVQKKIILDMITECKLKNLPIDANILVEMSNATGKDFSAIEPVDET